MKPFVATFAFVWAVIHIGSVCNAFSIFNFVTRRVISWTWIYVALLDEFCKPLIACAAVTMVGTSQHLFSGTRICYSITTLGRHGFILASSIDPIWYRIGRRGKSYDKDSPHAAIIKLLYFLNSHLLNKDVDVF